MGQARKFCSAFYTSMIDTLRRAGLSFKRCICALCGRNVSIELPLAVKAAAGQLRLRPLADPCYAYAIHVF